MGNRNEYQHQFEEKQVCLSPGGSEQLHTILENAEYWREAYLEASGIVLGMLQNMGATGTVAESFLLELARIDMDSGHNFGILPGIVEMLDRLNTSGVIYDEKIIRMMLDSVAVDEEGFIAWNAVQRERLCRVFLKYPYEQTCLKIAESLRPIKGRIGLGSKTNIVNNRSNQGEVSIASEYYCSREGDEYFSSHKVEFLKIGPLLFIDESLKKIIPQEIQQAESQNIIFVPDIDKTEFHGSLGYYTCNTIVSLLAADMRGMTIIDHGAGNGVLSAVALKLGAEKVIGIDYDANCINQAHKLAIANGYEEGEQLLFIKADLRERQVIAKKILAFAKKGPVGIISNLGYWPDYPITNITNLSYIKALNDVGLQTTLFVGGGYGDKETRAYGTEPDLLAQMGIDRSTLPIKDIDADRQILEALGFVVNSISESEQVIRSHHRPGSLVATH